MSNSPGLTLPHPRAHERAFVLAPWAQVDPGAMLTVDGASRTVAVYSPAGSHRFHHSIRSSTGGSADSSPWSAAPVTPVSRIRLPESFSTMEGAGPPVPAMGAVCLLYRLVDKSSAEGGGCLGAGSFFGGLLSGVLFKSSEGRLHPAGWVLSIVGAIVYFGYGYKHSRLRQQTQDGSAT